MIDCHFLSSFKFWFHAKIEKICKDRKIYIIKIKLFAFFSNISLRALREHFFIIGLRFNF